MAVRWGYSNFVTGALNYEKHNGISQQLSYGPLKLKIWHQ